MYGTLAIQMSAAESDEGFAGQQGTATEAGLQPRSTGSGRGGVAVCLTVVVPVSFMHGKSKMAIADTSTDRVYGAHWHTTGV